MGYLLGGLTLADYIIIIAAYFVLHYIILYFYNMKLSGSLIKKFRDVVEKAGCKIKSYRKKRGIHSLVVAEPCGVFSKFIMFTSLLPREMPINWLFAKLAHREDNMVLEGNLLQAPIFQCELLNKSSPRWRSIINKSSRGNWFHLNVKDSPFHVAIFRPSKEDIARIKDLLKKIKSDKNLVSIDRISLRISQPHVIINFSKKIVDEEKLLKAFHSLINILEVAIGYKVGKSGVKRGK